MPCARPDCPGIVTEEAATSHGKTHCTRTCFALWECWTRTTTALERAELSGNGRLVANLLADLAYLEQMIDTLDLYLAHKVRSDRRLRLAQVAPRNGTTPLNTAGPTA